ncbi:MAG: hypothetical protein H6661_09000 [Ardenticatenaceae bacterium]|nr:hypothetical protein [Ardenticatenaceae bacterium]
MPRLTRWYIRTAFLYLLLGFTIGALLLANKGIPLFPGLWRWLPVHVEFLLYGWVAQLTMGMAFWILPRYWQKPRRPHENYARAAFVLLNLGIWLVMTAAVLPLGRWVTFAGKGAELGAVFCFALHAWRRIVSRDGS